MPKFEANWLNTRGLDGVEDLFERSRVLLLVLLIFLLAEWRCGGRLRLRPSVSLDGPVAALHVAQEVAAVGQGVEVEPGGAREGVRHHAQAGGLQAPEVLLAVALVREEALILALKL